MPLPFHQLELTLQSKPATNTSGNINKNRNNEESVVRKVIVFKFNLLLNQLNHNFELPIKSLIELSIKNIQSYNESVNVNVICFHMASAC